MVLLRAEALDEHDPIRVWSSLMSRVRRVVPVHRLNLHLRHETLPEEAQGGSVVHQEEDLPQVLDLLLPEVLLQVQVLAAEELLLQ